MDHFKGRESVRVGKVVFYDKNDGSGVLIDGTYRDRTYKFFAKGYQAGQMVVYETLHINPISGFRVATVIAPKLWSGLIDN